MPAFTYHARDEAGRPVQGVLEAESQASLADRLRRMGYLVTRIGPVSTAPSWLALRWDRRVSPEALLAVAVQLANLVEAGVPLATSVATLAEQTPELPLREALASVRRAIDGGETFSQAVRHHPEIFPPLMASMAQVGEASGRLDAVLGRYAILVEKDLALRRAVQGALTYPAVLLVAALLLILFVVGFVVPQFAAVFARAGISLPLPTRLLWGVGVALRQGWWGLGLAALAGAVGGRIALQYPAVRLRVDRTLLSLPVVGPALHQTVVARFARTLATLVGAGLPILNALDTAGGVVDNQVMVQEIQRVRMAVERGERVAATLAVGQVFAPDAVQMIRVGEESGRLETMLDKVADFYELRVNFRLKQLTTLLEPIVLIGMGGIVALIMASLLLPMFDLVKVLQHGGLR